MQAVIIAAGRGTRLRRVFSPKPLTPIFGLSLIERIVLVAKLVGVRDFKIVVGYESDRIKQELGDGRKYGVCIEYIENEHWEKGNGVSVLKAREHVNERFLLLMSDHLFDEVILEELLKGGVNETKSVVCIDTNLSGDHFDLYDATKVRFEHDKVKKIDKYLNDFNAVDTGVLLYTREIFDALDESVKAGRFNLADGNQVLADRGRLGALDITGCFWIDVDDEKALKKARKRLIQQLFKPTDGPISKQMNRRLSTRISAFLARYNVSPNSITLGSFCLSMLSALFFFLGGHANVLAAGIMAQLSSILDGCDGEIARLKFKFSVFGKWLDKVLDRYADGLIVLGMTHAVWKATSNELVWLVGFLAMTGTFMNSYTATIYDDLLRKEFIKYNSMRIGRDVRLFIVFLGALFNQLFITIAILALITNTESIRRLFLLKDAYRIRSVH
ncbi:MAG: NTP transferase domain-containing protein [Candidatus Glassbacteria bacterium]